MSPRVTVSGVFDLPPLEEVGVVISIRDPDDRLPAALAGLGVPVLELVFHDTDGDALDEPPEAWHLEQVRRFLKREVGPEVAVHVHCFAGVSRSTAVASFVLACLRPDLSDAEIVVEVQAARPQAMPNRLLLKRADEVLGRRLSRAWRRQAGRY